MATEILKSRMALVILSLEGDGLEELRLLVQNLQNQIARAGNKLVYNLKKRDFLITLKEKNCDIVTAFLQAHSRKRTPKFIEVNKPNLRLISAVGANDNYFNSPEGAKGGSGAGAGVSRATSMEREWGEFQAGARRGRIAVPPVFEISAPFRAVPNFHAREIPQPRIFPRSVLLQVNEISTLHACKKAVDASLLVFSSPCLCFEQRNDQRPALELVPQSGNGPTGHERPIRYILGVVQLNGTPTRIWKRGTWGLMAYTSYQRSTANYRERFNVRRQQGDRDIHAPAFKFSGIKAE
ncbi:unnamed protein product [Bemisia tabaci]|uniref:Uncharacterized protein n=1 Tax=Bemisia tabaci TaxID=7038 RepID=A0A9P0EVQ3_BEMTA|nr:unnamed protein product [Bemisia tabaci]